MQKEKFNNMWKDKLEDTEGLPQAVLENKDAAWEKLYARLDEKPRRKMSAWYWFAAAACLILAITVPLLTTNTSKNISQHTNVHSNINSFAKKDEVSQNVTVQTKTPAVQAQLNSAIKTKKNIKEITTADTSNTTLVYINKQEPAQNEAAVTSPVIIDTPAMVAISITPQQKKLKVVHINELGEPAEAPATFARNTDLHLFQLKLAQQEIYNASRIASNNNSILSFKPKNFPN